MVNADDALRRIRPVKSDAEITLMRYAAQANAEAGLQAAATVRAGADVRELRAAYFAAVAARGMRGMFLVIDRVSSPTYEATLRDGQCFSIDCVSEYMGYHGDFARAVYMASRQSACKKYLSSPANHGTTFVRTSNQAYGFPRCAAWARISCANRVLISRSRSRPLGRSLSCRPCGQHGLTAAGRHRPRAAHGAECGLPPWVPPAWVDHPTWRSHADYRRRCRAHQQHRHQCRKGLTTAF